ncbi:hypothetical protein [Streptomyces ochraceiscleroticus]|uniref:DUF3180 domain-containing protein n=1 Tax=Streptomyces ochraceiscleroticus TaxID=47761 RepID=A0ABW1MHN6_9ACTN|nr:hypothetical protein [Streptomyces ochraceiscleroticus]
MLRHEFQPARLVTGLTALGIGGVYVLDAAGRVDVPGAWPLIALPAGLFLSGGVSALYGLARRRRGAELPPPEEQPVSR